MMLEDYSFSKQLRYEDHILIQESPDSDEPLQIRGVFGAALMSAMLVATDEGQRRGIAIDTEQERRAWMNTYKHEVLRDGWGVLTEEAMLLSDAYIQLTVDQKTPDALCWNIRLLDMARTLVIEYMQQLVKEEYGKHIWDYVLWQAPFAQWLLKAAFVETERQLFLHIDWTDEVAVTSINYQLKRSNYPTLRFEDESARDILSRFFRWRWKNWQVQQLELPGVKPTSTDNKNLIIEQEHDWSECDDVVKTFSEQDRKLWLDWMSEWQDYLERQLKPQREIQFWTKNVAADTQARLIHYLRIQENEPMHYLCVSVAVYALRQLGFVRRSLTMKDMLTWLTDHLENDYVTKNNAYQFRRAWNEHGRYTPAVKDEIDELYRRGLV